MKVLGIEKVDYTNKNGQRIQGTKLHLGYQKENTEGMCVMSEFIGQGVISDVEIGNVIELLYNKFGKVVHVTVVSC